VVKQGFQARILPEGFATWKPKTSVAFKENLNPGIAALLEEAAALSAQLGLLTNDATIVALMHRHALTNLATNDDDFDGVPGVTVWKPR